MEKVVVVAGVTASGKSRLAVQLAKRFNGEIISADAYQVYKDMDIGTNKTTPEKMEGVPHHLIDCVSVDQTWDVSVFQKQARKIVSDLTKKDKLPIVCGGTGFYVNALIKDYHFMDLPQKGDYESFTNEELHAMLMNADKEEALKIAKNNRRRLEKALDFVSTNGIKKSEHDSNSNKFVYDALIIFLDPPKEQVHELISKRAGQMLADGWQEEVDRLQKTYPDFAKTAAAKAIGYQQLFTKDHDLSKITDQIMEYGRKQRTWFVNKHQERTVVLKGAYSKDILQSSIEAVENFLKQPAQKSTNAA